MSHKKIFFERRGGGERRSGKDQRDNPRLDLVHRRRRKLPDRRSADRSISDDFLALHGWPQAETAPPGSLH